MDVQNVSRMPAQPPVDASQNPPPRETPKEAQQPPAREAERPEAGNRVDYRA